MKRFASGRRHAGIFLFLMMKNDAGICLRSMSKRLVILISVEYVSYVIRKVIGEQQLDDCERKVK